VSDPDLGELLARHASAQGVPGAALGVLRDGVVTVATYGIEDVRTGSPVVAGSRFSAGSLTKSMVATVVARAAAQGRLGLGDRVASHVPELAGAGWAKAATLRDLLGNRSGLPLRFGLEFDFESTDAGDDALARLAARVAAEDSTPVSWSYTNVGYALLGRAIETVIGRVWEEAMRAELFEPARMSEAVFALQDASVDRVAGHDVTDAGPLAVEPLTTRALGPAGTTLVSTIADLLAFARLQLEDPALRVLREQCADVRIHAWLDRWCLGFGWFAWPGADVLGWDGLIDGERGVLRLIPGHRAAVVLMTNGSTGRLVYRALFPELMQSLFGVEVPPLRLDPDPGAAGDLSKFVGTYAWPDRRVDVSAVGERLVITSDDRAHEASPINGRAFLVDPLDPDNPTVTFGGFDAEGRPQILYLMLWGLPRIGDD
jgi:CubicO group peptidase (beta-lactamase class C family)